MSDTCFPIIAIMYLMIKCARLAIKYFIHIVSYNSQSNTMRKLKFSEVK